MPGDLTGSSTESIAEAEQKGKQSSLFSATSQSWRKNTADSGAKKIVYIESLSRENDKLSPIFTNTHTPHQWLDAYIAYSRERSPRGYSTLHEMSGLFALSGTVAGRVRIVYGREHSTGLYFLACAKSSHYAKSTTADVARSVMEKAGLWWRFGPDMMTPQLMLSFMANPKEHQKQKNEMKGSHQKPLTRQEARKYHEGQLSWIYDEFSQKLSAMMRDSGPYAEFHGILRKFNERPKSFEYGTRSFGFERVSYPCLTLMGLTTPAELRKFGGVGGQLWRDGFFARFVMAGPSPSDIALLTPPQEDIPPVPLAVLRPLAELNQQLAFRENYNRPLPLIRMNPPLSIKNMFFEYECFLHEVGQDNQDLQASYKRLAVEHCPKFAALLAVVDKCENVEWQHAQRAIEIGERVRICLNSLYNEITTLTPTEKERRQLQKEEKVIKILHQANKPITVSEIRRKTGANAKYRMSNQELHTVLNILEANGVAKGWPKWPGSNIILWELVENAF
jgi:hypothetical protein